jgi:putative ABC transport system substrate-binding protein
MKKEVFGLALGAMLFALCLPAEAQQPAKIPRIGYIGGGAASDTSRIEALRLGLRELGYVEGKNIVIDNRYEEEKVESPLRTHIRARRAVCGAIVDLF